MKLLRPLHRKLVKRDVKEVFGFGNVMRNINLTKIATSSLDIMFLFIGISLTKTIEYIYKQLVEKNGVTYANR